MRKEYQTRGGSRLPFTGRSLPFIGPMKLSRRPGNGGGTRVGIG